MDLQNFQLRCFYYTSIRDMTNAGEERRIRVTRVTLSPKDLRRLVRRLFPDKRNFSSCQRFLLPYEIQLRYQW